MKKASFAFFVLLLLLSGCLPVKSLFLGGPDHKDMQRFPSKTIETGEDCFSFPISTRNIEHSLKVNDWTKDIPFFVTLPELLGVHKVRSFVVIQQDSILYEYYGRGTSKTDLHASYSMAKSFTATLIGIAIDGGFIESEQDLVSKYIPELDRLEEAQTLTIEHLLNHTSGISYSLAMDATIYYGSNILKALKRLRFESKPGKKQHYLNINVQLLGLILKRATGKEPSKYLEEKIWQPIQMCTPGIWSVDKKGLEKTYCCLGATALNYAKFGRLYLNKGNWDGKQIFSETWYNKSIRRDTTQGSSFNYNYCWHIGLKEYGDFMAIGLYKQHIYINPDKELLIVLLNDGENKLAAERVNWWYVFRQIADEL